jgi:hypothetical protein
LLGVVSDVWAKSIYHPAEVVIAAQDKVPGFHIRLERGVHRGKASMEETTAEIAEDLVLRVIPGT